MQPQLDIVTLLASASRRSTRADDDMDDFDVTWW
jgi:hypothetical protein